MEKNIASWTPEPWEFGFIPVSNAEDIKRELLADLQQAINSHTGSWGENLMVIYRQDGARLAYLAGPTAELNCARIVACVNACAGLTDDQLDEFSDGSMKGWMDEAEERLKAVDSALDCVEYSGYYEAGIEKLKQQNAELSAQLAISQAMYESGCYFEDRCKELSAQVADLEKIIEEKENAIKLLVWQIDSRKPK